MAWMETNPTEQRQKFVEAYASEQWSMAELCERYQVTRPTGYKWVKRYQEEGKAGLAERSRAPRTCPHRTTPEMEELILSIREEHRWGAKKLRQELEKKHAGKDLPARSTLNAILERHGKLRKQRRRKRWDHPGAAPLTTERANQISPVDFKGQFRTKDGESCYPLTMTDHYSRALLICKALPSIRTEYVKPVFLRHFREAGLPEVIRTDNGAPFASTGIHGLCALNVWWIRLGIVHQRIRPSSPQENGTHERMHRELKRETAQPPAWNLRGQQRRFDRFKTYYNEERPHDGINGAYPSERWEPSPRPYPEKILGPEYPGHLEVRRVSTAGTFRLKFKQPFLSHALANDYIGLEEVDDGVWNIIYYRTLLGRYDERNAVITGT
jgi:transposase InsO family protein